MLSPQASDLMTDILPLPLSSLPLSPVLHYLAAALSALVLFLCYSTSMQDSLEQELDEEKIRIVEQEEQKEQEAPCPVLLPPVRSSFLLPTPSFQWPQHAGVVHMVRGRRQGATHLSQELRGKLQELGIYRGQDQEQGQEQEVEGAAMAAGKLLPRRSVRISFDTFQAKARPGLETTEEEDDGSLATDANLMTLVMLGRRRMRQGQQHRKTPASRPSSASSTSSTSSTTSSTSSTTPSTSSPSSTSSYPPSVLGLENIRRLVSPI